VNFESEQLCLKDSKVMRESPTNHFKVFDFFLELDLRKKILDFVHF
jgi:hypothetical protein